MLDAILTRYPVKVITPSFLIHAQIEPMGPLLDYLNDAARTSVPFWDATLYDLSGKIQPSTRPMVVIQKSHVCGMYIDDAKGRESIRLLKRVQKLIAHVPNLIYRGEIHLGTETRDQDIFDVLIGQFFALTNASVFPTIKLPAEFPQQTEMLLVHKDALQAYYME